MYKYVVKINRSFLLIEQKQDQKNNNLTKSQHNETRSKSIILTKLLTEFFIFILPGWHPHHVTIDRSSSKGLFICVFVIGSQREQVLSIFSAFVGNSQAREDILSSKFWICSLKPTETGIQEKF